MRGTAMKKSLRFMITTKTCCQDKLFTPQSGVKLNDGS